MGPPSQTKKVLNLGNQQQSDLERTQRYVGYFFIGYSKVQYSPYTIIKLLSDVSDHSEVVTPLCDDILLYVMIYQTWRLVMDTAWNYIS